MSEFAKSSDACRGCDSKNLATIMDFGPQPLAGYYPLQPESKKKALRYPLELVQCRDCGLLQVTTLPPIDEVFHDEYRYASSTIPDLRRHFDEYAEWLQAAGASGRSVLEFGCNDGVLLEALKRRGIDAQGVDASDNVASIARSRGHRVVTGFLDRELVVRNDWNRKFDFVTCSNVFAHVHDLTGTIGAVVETLKDGGHFSVEVHDAELMVNEGQFDTIYHEHLTYFSLDTLASTLARSGFEIVRRERTAMHGGGLRVLAKLAKRRTGDRVWPLSKIVPAVGRLAQALAESRAAVRSLFDEHGPLVGYGAAGRAQMFINLTGTQDCFARVFDDSHLRQDRYIAGTDIPIVPYQNQSGACLVILAWNYAETIRERVGDHYSAVVTVLPTLRCH